MERCVDLGIGRGRDDVRVPIPVGEIVNDEAASRGWTVATLDAGVVVLGLDATVS